MKDNTLPRPSRPKRLKIKNFTYDEIREVLADSEEEPYGELGSAWSGAKNTEQDIGNDYQPEQVVVVI
ncbi:hypothetical protein QE152_g37308 [Popillia japonica]|uniref:Uncharacterized protein n=1 Tax=Popillia japonica TaxID=7064 RepID=A0AAW1IA71_POPJA